MADINFDSLIDRFKNNIYGGIKGRVRESVVLHHLKLHLPQLAKPGLHCVDVGAGLGNMSLWLADQGHRVDYCDISESMLRHARQQIEEKCQNAKAVSYHQGRFQDLKAEPYDFVLCQAVLEWLIDPMEGLEKLGALTKPGACLALFFYNREAIRFKNLIKGNLSSAQKEVRGDGKGLTPINPLAKNDIFKGLEAMGFEITHHFGVRCFVDYFYPNVNKDDSQFQDDALALEIALSDQEPYRSLARYIGVFAYKK